MFRILKPPLIVSHLHQRADYPLRLTVGLRAGSTGKLLSDIVHITGDAKLVVGTTFVLNPIIGINILYRLRTAANHIAQQKLGDTLYYLASADFSSKIRFTNLLTTCLRFSIIRIEKYIIVLNFLPKPRKK